MKATQRELANETTTGTTGISTIQGKEWLKTILETAKKKMFFEQFAYVSMTAKGVKDHAVPIATTNLSFTDSTSEATARTMTEVDNANTVVFTPAPHKFGACISKETVRTSQVDMVKFARGQMAYHAALSIDTAFATVIAAATPTATYYGGDATSTASLEAGDIITTNLCVKGQSKLKQNGWYPENDKPFVLFIPAICEEAFLSDSQFVHAGEKGDTNTIINGYIGKYLGTLVVVSEQCPADATWGASGHTCFMVKAKVSYGIVYGEKPSLDFEYKKDEAAYYIYLDMAYKAEALQENAIVHIKVSDA